MKLPKQTEKQFQNHVIQLAKLNGWMTYHTYDSRRSTPGFPDLVLVRPPRVIFAELKGTGGRTTAAQEHWLGNLILCPGVETHLWNPEDMDEIERDLKR